MNQNLNDLDSILNIAILLHHIGVIHWQELGEGWQELADIHAEIRLRSIETRDQYNHNGGRNGIKEWKK